MQRIQRRVLATMNHTLFTRAAGHLRPWKEAKKGVSHDESIHNPAERINRKTLQVNIERLKKY